MEKPQNQPKNKLVENLMLIKYYDLMTTFFLQTNF